MTKVRYEIEVDKDVFPYAPGSEVIVRDTENSAWDKDLYVFYDKREPTYHHRCVGSMYRYCRPFATHGHLLGTKYHADTPACVVCGKAVIIMPQDYEVCQCRGCQEQPTPTTAEPNALSSELDACKEDEVSPQWWIWYNHEFSCFVYLGKDENAYASKDGTSWIEVTCIPKHIMAEKWRVRRYVNSRLSHDLFSANSSSVVSTPDHASTPEQLSTITAERDALRAELDALRATAPTPQPGEFQPSQRVLVRDHDNLPWRAALYSCKHNEGRHHCHCCGGTWRHVLPYEGNEHLLGTTDDPAPVPPKDTDGLTPARVRLPIAWYNGDKKVHVRVEVDRTIHISKDLMMWRRMIKVPSIYATRNNIIASVDAYLNGAVGKGDDHS